MDVTEDTAAVLDPEQVRDSRTCTPGRWEYLTVPVVAAGFEDAAGVENYTAVLNDYGSQGWELVGVTGYPGKSVEGWVVLFSFKRPVAGVTRVE